MGEPLVRVPLSLFHPEQVFQPYLLELRAQTAQAELRRRLVVGIKLDPGGPAVGLRADRQLRVQV